MFGNKRVYLVRVAAQDQQRAERVLGRAGNVVSSFASHMNEGEWMFWLETSVSKRDIEKVLADDNISHIGEIETIK